MSRRIKQHSEGFRCIRCGTDARSGSFGTRHRNHCPCCLGSRHVDDTPGDRACACRSVMEPIGIDVRTDSEWALIHRCTGCGTIRTNRIAGDDRDLSLLQLALRPLANPPFPLDALPVPGRPR